MKKARERENSWAFCSAGCRLGSPPASNDRKNRPQPEGYDLFFMPVAGVEPARYRYQRILSFLIHSELPSPERNLAVTFDRIAYLKIDQNPVKPRFFGTKRVDPTQKAQSRINELLKCHLCAWRDVGGMYSNTTTPNNINRHNNIIPTFPAIDNTFWESG